MRLDRVVKYCVQRYEHNFARVNRRLRVFLGLFRLNVSLIEGYRTRREYALGLWSEAY